MKAFLRDATRSLHEDVDTAFARFGLEDRASYVALLRAHGRAVPAVEAALAGVDGWRPRAPLLAADFADLGEAMPPPAAFAPPGSGAEALGIVYVLEGSRLGGVMLARSVGEGLPRRYLAAAHRPGEWRALLTTIEQAAARGGEAWRAAAVAGAVRTFEMYRSVAEA